MWGFFLLKDLLLNNINKILKYCFDSGLLFCWHILGIFEELLFLCSKNILHIYTLWSLTYCGLAVIFETNDTILMLTCSL